MIDRTRLVELLLAVEGVAENVVVEHRIAFKSAKLSYCEKLCSTS